MSWFGSLLADIVYLTIFLAVSIVTFFYYRFQYWQQKQIPHLTPSFPFGNIKELVLYKKSVGQTLCSVYRQIKDKGCKYGGFYMYSTPVLIVTDPEVIKSVLTKNFSNFHDRVLFVDPKLEPLLGNLFTITGLKWRNLRKRTTPTFTSGKIKVMFQTLCQTSEELVNVMENKVKTSESIHIRELLSNYTMDVIASVVFGLEIHSLRGDNTEFRHYGTLFMQSTLANNFTLSFGFAYSKLISLLRIRTLIPEVRDFFTNLLKTSIETREKNNIQRNDFLDMYIKMKKNGSVENDGVDALTFDEFAAQAFLFFIAGYDTTAQSLTFCFYELSKHPEIQDKLREEIESVLEKTDGKLTYESVFEMEYLDQVVKETFRKYPTTDSFQRKCTEPCKLNDSHETIDKGTPVWISVIGLHRDPEYYPDPEKFDPERFSKEEVAKRHPYSYLPFGEGPRACIASRFAYLQIKTGIIMLIKNYKFSLDPKTKTSLEFAARGLLMSTKDIVYLNATKVK